MRLHVLSLSGVGFSAVACMLALLLFAPRSQAQDLKLSNMNPTKGVPGNKVTITGDQFCSGSLCDPAKQNIKVTFSGIRATVIESTENTITVEVPASVKLCDAVVVVSIDKDKNNQKRIESPGTFTVLHLDPDHGPVGKVVQISDVWPEVKGKDIGNEKVTVKVGGKIANKYSLRSNKQLIFEMPETNAAIGSKLDVIATVDGYSKKEGVFTLDSPAPPPVAAIPPPVAAVLPPVAVVPPPVAAASVILAITPSSGVAGIPVTITGTGFGKSQGTVTIGGQKTDFAKGGWKDTEIDVTVPDLKVTTDTDEPIVILDESAKINSTGSFKETTPPSPVIASVTPFVGVAGTQVTINGRGFGDLQGKSTVTIGNLPATVAATKGWSDSQIVVTAPDLSQAKDLERENCSDVTAPDPIHVNGLDMKNCIVAMISVSVAGTDNKTPVKVATDKVEYFVETPPQWSDKDEKPGSIRFVGGYEQGYQSAQPSASDAFLAVYGRSLFLKDRFGPYYQIRLQTAPQASGTNGVVSVLTNPSGAVTTQNLQTVGSAVDMTLGLEYQIHPWLHHGQSSLGFIAGGGFVTPLQVNSVNASYTMPAYGTIECTELQSRLSGVLSNPIYAGITATTPTTTPTTTYCYTNKTTSTPTNVTTLEYAAPNQPNFFPKYFAGVRLVNRYPGATGLKQCNENNPCERGYIDFTLGQDASITGGSLKHLVVGVDSIYPLPVPSLNFLYIFGSISQRLVNLPSSQPPLVLQLPASSGPNSPSPSPNPAILVLPMTQPDRDFYRIGVGVSLNQIFTALTKPKPASGSQ